MRNISQDMLVQQVMAAVAAGTTEQKSSVLDMSGYENVCFIASFGTITSTNVLTVSAYGNTASSTSSPAPVQIASSIAGPYTSATGTIVIVDVIRPALRYIYCDILRTTANAVINCVIAIQYQAAGPLALSQVSTVIGYAISNPGS